MFCQRRPRIDPLRPVGLLPNPYRKRYMGRESPVLGETP